MREGAKESVQGKRPRKTSGETMSQKDEFHNLDNLADGLFRELASGVTTRIFSGEHAMLSVVTLAPHAQGTLHHHPEEQWGMESRLKCND
jgi:quercetin dioxygenase-like cupin family protein